MQVPSKLTRQALVSLAWAILPFTAEAWAQPAGSGEPLAGTERLTLEGDIASQLVEGVDRFLLRKLAESEQTRQRHWHRDTSSPEAYEASVAANRARLAERLGLKDLAPLDDVAARLEARRSGAFEPLAAHFTPHASYRTELLIHGVWAEYVEWHAFGDVHGEGWLLRPTTERMIADDFRRHWIVVIPDADQSPEQLIGLAPSHEICPPYALRLALSGATVLVPARIDRALGRRHAPGHEERASTLSTREFLHRPGFELGRHLIGLEVQTIMASIDAMSFAGCGLLADEDPTPGPASVAVAGWGEGAALALYTAALDRRVRAVFLSGYFGDRRHVWREPIDRNVFGLLDEFGDAELVSLVAPRAVIVEAAQGPQLSLPGDGGAPAELAGPPLAEVQREFGRAQSLVADPGLQPVLELVETPDGQGAPASTTALAWFYGTNVPGANLVPEPTGRRISNHRGNFCGMWSMSEAEWLSAQWLNAEFVSRCNQLRRDRLVNQYDRHLQQVLTESPYTREKFLARLDPSSPEKYRQTSDEYRAIFRDQVIGRFDDARLPPRPRTRQTYATEKWTGYEVVLDVFPDVIAYGLLLVPKDLEPGERRPVVVCQHGLEGRPQDTIGEPSFQYYQAFAARLAERGFITFAPQNLYIFTDRFRSLQRKANPLGKTLFSVIVPQHEQITDWLAALPMVDPQRIAFYGLSYGGKSAMRIPPLVERYCLSICSADFNDWVWKNASTRSPYSYVWTGEYEIFEWDLGSTFNYAEMAALIAPRPFMVERGHHDGVAPDEAVAGEYAKVRRLYARLGIPERTEIEFFDGPHQIHGVGTFAFLHRHLNWPEPAGPEPNVPAVR